MSDDQTALEADIARTREELAHTVDELAARLDVKARARQRLARTRDQAAFQVQRVREQAVRENRPTPVAIAVAGVLVVCIAVVVWRRRG